MNISYTVEGIKCVAKPHAAISAPPKRAPLNPRYSPAYITNKYQNNKEKKNTSIVTHPKSLPN